MSYISLFHVFSNGVHKNQILRVKDELHYMHMLLDDIFCSMGQSQVLQMAFRKNVRLKSVTLLS